MKHHPSLPKKNHANSKRIKASHPRIKNANSFWIKKTISILFLCFAILTVTNSQKIFKVGAFNYYPAIFQDTDGLVKGFYVDALKELGEKENLEFVFVYGSWDEGLERIKTGEVDLLTSVAITDERLNYMDYTATPLLTVWSEVYVNKKSEINGILDLEGKTIAVMKSDFNGKYLKQLTEKLAITCDFIETTDFEEVFKLISGNKVNAGVVNNTFGAPKSIEYGLLSSGIILNPFDIYFTVKKDSNKELLKTLNSYLHDWEHDRNSVYNIARQKWSQGHIGAIEVFPEWLETTIYLVLLVVVILFTFIGLLRYKIRAATKKIKYSELLFKTFMENTPAYVYIKDEHLNHMYRNRMVDTVNSLAPNDKISSAKTVFEPHIAELVEKMDKEILSTKKNQCDLQYFCKLNGENTWLHDYKFYLKLPNGKPAIAGLSFDITKLKNTESELIKAKERAEESDHLKSAFLANMSHEIRTPMNGILGFANLLKNPDLSGEQRQKYIEIINKSGIRMLNIINDIIDISKIESGLMKVDIREANINEQIEFIYNFFKAEAGAKGLSFSFKSPLPAEKAIIKTDSEKVYAILTNLVKNAIKYTPDGSIELGCIFVEADKSLQFQINDTGVGIPKNRQKAIFDRFIQADIFDKRAYQGAGLGLAISKAYVEMLGGEIWVESEEGKGTTFFFTLPYNTAPMTDTIDCKAVPSEGKDDLRKLKILIAEDDEVSEMLLHKTITIFSSQVYKARTGIEAVEVCHDNPDIDLILMDIQMPAMGGYEAAQQIRKFNKKVVIIAQTAYALSGDREKSIIAGCNDYIAKPINQAELQSLIQKHFEKIQS